MSAIVSERQRIFSASTEAAFLQHLMETPNSRRVSSIERVSLIDWLRGSHSPPSSQKEFSRRNYVRKTFSWEENTQTLYAAPKKKGDRPRLVVTEENILETVEKVHQENGHAGWNITWSDISQAFYGILRTDVIFLLRQCQVCAINPRKRPKGSSCIALDPLHVHSSGDMFNIEELLCAQVVDD